MFIYTLDQIETQNPSLTGGKGASLGNLHKSNFPIPPAFIISTDGFKQFKEREVSEIFKKEVLNSFDKLQTKQVAVRSSATAEDSSTASWAGQLETYLNVSQQNLFQKIRDCWQSVNSNRAKKYLEKQNAALGAPSVAVIIQKMVQPSCAGVMFTINPVTNNSDEIMIEAVKGLGDKLVQGTTTPSNYLIDKNSHQVKNTSEQVLDGEAILDSSLIEGLTQMAIKIEEHFKKPQDIEWAVDENKKIWILQSRPITTI